MQTKQEPASDRHPRYCAGRCDFAEVYYGWECKICGLFYAFGQAPWDEESDDDDECGC